MATILKISIEKPEMDLIDQACAVLAKGGLVIVPTETVYGIACDPSVEGAMENLIRAKGRDDKKPIARLVANGEQVKALATNWNKSIEKLANTYWPGPLTMVLATADGFTGFRVPDHAVAIALAERYGKALALTSANKSGGPDPKTAQDAAYAVHADIVLDSGPASDDAIPSTVIKIDGDEIVCLREGCLPVEEILHCRRG